MKPSPILPLTDECHHYSSKDEVPWDLQKYDRRLSMSSNFPDRNRYFSQRYSIFQYYDDGVYLTDDAWFGVTPEPVAL